MAVPIKAEPLIEGLVSSLEKFNKGFNETVEDIIGKDPFCGHDFYIFCTFKLKSREDPYHRYIHQPTVMKPNPIPGSSCLRVDISNKSWDLLWALPLEEFMSDFGQSIFDHPNKYYKEFVLKCIKDYKAGRLNPKPEDDPSKGEVKEIIRSMELRRVDLCR